MEWEVVMAAPSLIETRARAGDLRPLRKWVGGWRLAAVATAATGVAAGLGLAWNWLNSGHVLILLVIAGPCILACLLWSLLSDGGSDKTAPEPMGTSDWEMRIRPRFPRDERPEIDVKRQDEGGEA
jgi:hypothetical protein